MKNKGHSIFFKAVMPFMDVFISFSIFLSVGLHFQNDETGYFGNGSMKVAIVFVLVNMAVAEMLNVYKAMYRKKSEILMCEAIAGMIAGFAAMVYAIVDRAYAFTEIAVQHTVIVSVFTTIPVLCIWRLILDSAIQHSVGRERLVAVSCGDTEEDNKWLERVKRSGEKWFDIHYIHAEEDDVIKTLSEYTDNYEGILITQSMPEHIKRKILDEAIREKKNVYIVPNLYEINLTRYLLIQFDDTPAFLIKPFSLQPYQAVLKRAMDIIMSLIGIIITSPIMLIATIAISIDSKGPIIYMQERVTVDKRRFYIYKFRTMVDNAERESGPRLASSGDSRITRVGRILRAWRIDELPQMFNILRGDMSIVGPRPERPVFVDKYSEKYPGYDMRFIVKAGLTGYAQTYGKYDTDINDKLLYDLLYIREYSLILDIKIIFLTLKTVLTHNG